MTNLPLLSVSELRPHHIRGRRERGENTLLRRENSPRRKNTLPRYQNASLRRENSPSRSDDNLPPYHAGEDEPKGRNKGMKSGQGTMTVKYSP